MSEVQQLPIVQQNSAPQQVAELQPVTEHEAPVTTPPPQTDYEKVSTALKAWFNPALLVFDCDWTLYPYDCDKDRMAPFTLTSWGEVYDCYHRFSNPYCSVPAIFGAIADAGIPVAFLSRNPSASQVRNLLSNIPCLTKDSPTPKTLWDTMPSHHYFHAYSSGGVGSGKDKHFAAIKGVCGTEFANMLFFDDMPDNIAAAQKQGTTSVHLKKGLTVEAFLCGIQGWRTYNAPPPLTGL
jgi:hypothetical protein